MGKIDKVKKSVQQNKKFLIVIAVLWLIIAIVLVAPIAVAWANIENPETPNIVQNFINEVTSFTSFFRMFTNVNALATFGKLLIPYTLFVLYASYKGYEKTKPKGEYYDKEHGSSDWSTKGSQYKILSKDNGLILAKDNCLPLDKRGNINTLIVGGSGSGKSTGYSIPNAYQMLGSYVFTDPKGE